MSSSAQQWQTVHYVQKTSMTMSYTRAHHKHIVFRQPKETNKNDLINVFIKFMNNTIFNVDVACKFDINKFIFLLSKKTDFKTCLLTHYQHEKIKHKKAITYIFRRNFLFHKFKVSIWIVKSNLECFAACPRFTCAICLSSILLNGLFLQLTSHAVYFSIFSLSRGIFSTTYIKTWTKISTKSSSFCVWGWHNLVYLRTYVICVCVIDSHWNDYVVIRPQPRSHTGLGWNKFR